MQKSTDYLGDRVRLPVTVLSGFLSWQPQPVLEEAR